MTEERIEPPFNSDPMTDAEWEPFARATGIEPPPDCADLLGCPCCGGTRIERFTVDRFIVLACADCGAHETETTRDR